MKLETREILESADDPLGYECPNNDWSAIPWDEYQTEVKAIKEDLLERLGFLSKLEGCVQDSSHHESLYVDIPWKIDPETKNAYGFIIRFSNFSKLYTIHGNKPSIYNCYLEKMKLIVNSYNWTFVESEEFQEPYNGVNELLKGGGITWYNRFFYYL